MTWAWLAPLAVAGLGASVLLALAAAVQREAARVRLARVEVRQARPGARHYRGDGR
jgi:hypothetical protein